MHLFIKNRVHKGFFYVQLLGTTNGRILEIKIGSSVCIEVGYLLYYISDPYFRKK